MRPADYICAELCELCRRPLLLGRPTNRALFTFGSFGPKTQRDFSPIPFVPLSSWGAHASSIRPAGRHGQMQK